MKNKDDVELVDVRPKEKVEEDTLPAFKAAPCDNYLTSDKTSFIPKEDISKQLEKDGLDTSKKMIFSCGGGITACINEVAAIMVGAEDTAIFDGSYQEYSKYGKPDFSKENWEESYGA